MAYSLLVVGIIVAVPILLILLVVAKYRRIHALRATRVHIIESQMAPVEKISASTMSGNLVIEQKNVPISDTYHFSKTKLGKGSSAEVVVGTHVKSRRKYAIKIIDTSKHSSKRLFERYEREKNFLRDLDHTNIVRLFEVYCAEKSQYFVMELCTGGHLGQVIAKSPDGHLAVDVAREYIMQLTRAVAYLHSLKICHRDIKLQNILLESDQEGAQIKLIDFGNSWRFRKGKVMTKIVGTTYTAAPEVLRESYDERCDVWSVGVVSFILLSGRRPFEAIDIPGQPLTRESSLIASILMGRYHFHHDVWEDVPPIAVHYIKWCLELDYKKRKSSSDLLNHPWLARNDLHSALGVGISRHQASILHRRLSQNSGNSGLRRTSMVAVAFTMPADKMKQMRDMFQQIDKDGSGNLEKDEFHEAMMTVDPTMSAKDIDLLFDSMDVDGDRQISFLEFVAATVDPREVDIQEVNQAFRLLDKDGKGYITNEDLLRVIGTSSVEERDVDKNEKKAQRQRGSGGSGASSGGNSRNPSGSSNAANRPKSADGVPAGNSSPGPGVTNGTTIGTPVRGASSSSITAAVTGGAEFPTGGPSPMTLPGGGSNSSLLPKTSGSAPTGSGVVASAPVTKQEKAERRRNQLMTRIAKIIQQSDVNNDGVISYAEFLLAMTGDAAAEQELKNAEPMGRDSGDAKRASNSSMGGSGSHARVSSGAASGGGNPLSRGGSLGSSAMAGARRSSMSGPVGHSLSSFALGGLSRQQSGGSYSKHNSGSMKHSSCSSAAGGDNSINSSSESDSAAEKDDSSDKFLQLEEHDSFAVGSTKRRQSDGNLRQYKSQFSVGGRTVKDNLNFAKIEEEQGWGESMTSDLGGGPASAGGGSSIGLSGVGRFIATTVVDFVFGLFGRKSARTYAQEAEAIAGKRAEQTDVSKVAPSGAHNDADGGRHGGKKKRAAAWQPADQIASDEGKGSADGGSHSGSNRGVAVVPAESLHSISDLEGSGISTKKCAPSSHSDSKEHSRVPESGNSSCSHSDLEKGLESKGQRKSTPSVVTSSGLRSSISSTAADMLKFITTGGGGASEPLSFNGPDRVPSPPSDSFFSHNPTSMRAVSPDLENLQSVAHNVDDNYSSRSDNSSEESMSSQSNATVDSEDEDEGSEYTASENNSFIQTGDFSVEDHKLRRKRRAPPFKALKQDSWMGSDENEHKEGDGVDLEGAIPSCGTKNSSSFFDLSLDGSPGKGTRHHLLNASTGTEGFNTACESVGAENPGAANGSTAVSGAIHNTHTAVNSGNLVYAFSAPPATQSHAAAIINPRTAGIKTPHLSGTSSVSTTTPLTAADAPSLSAINPHTVGEGRKREPRPLSGGSSVASTTPAAAIINPRTAGIKTPYLSGTSSVSTTTPLTAADAPSLSAINPHTVGEGRKREPRPLSGGSSVASTTPAAAIINPRTAGIKTPYLSGTSSVSTTTPLTAADAPSLSAINPHTVGEGRKREPRPLSGGSSVASTTPAAAIINPRTAGIKTTAITGFVSDFPKKKEESLANINPHTSGWSEERPRKHVRPLIVPTLSLNTVTMHNGSGSTPLINPHTSGAGAGGNSVRSFADKGSPRTAAIINPRTAGIKTAHTAGTAAAKKHVETSAAVINPHTTANTTPRFLSFGSLSGESPVVSPPVINPRTAGIKTTYTIGSAASRPISGVTSVVQSPRDVLSTQNAPNNTNSAAVSSAPGNVTYSFASSSSSSASVLNPHTAGSQQSGGAVDGSKLAQRPLSGPQSGRGDSLPPTSARSLINPRSYGSDIPPKPEHNATVRRKSESRSRPHSGTSRRSSNSSLLGVKYEESDGFDGLGVGDGSLSIDGAGNSNTSTSANNIRNIVSQVKQTLLAVPSPRTSTQGFYLFSARSGDDSTGNSTHNTPRVTPRVGESIRSTPRITPRVTPRADGQVSAGDDVGLESAASKYRPGHRLSIPNVILQKFPAVLEEDNDNSEPVMLSGKGTKHSINRVSSLANLDDDDYL